MAELFLRGRKISELKISEIRVELTKRSLPKKGNKAAILKRLEKALLQEKLSEVSPESVARDDGNQVEEMEDTPTAGSDNFLEVTAEEENTETSKNEEGDTSNNDSSYNITTTTQQTELCTPSMTAVTATAEDASDINVKTYVLDVDVNKVTPVKKEDNEKNNETIDTNSIETPFSINLDKQEEVTTVCSPSVDDINNESTGNDIIANDYPFREEELIYEGDVDHEEEKAEEKMEEEEKDVLIIDVNAKDLDLSMSNIDKTSEEFKRKPDAKKMPPSQQSSNADTTSSCNLWVSNLAATVSAADLKTFFSPYGQVVSVKVIARTHNKGERFGFIVMGSADQAKKSVQSLSGSELKRKAVTVEIANSTTFPNAGDKSKQAAVAKTTEKPTPTSTSTTGSGATPKGGVTSKPNKDTSKNTGANSSKKSPSSKGSSSQKNTKTANKLDSNNTFSSSSSSKDRRDFSSKRIVAVEGQNGKKELYTTRNRKDSSKRHKSRSPVCPRSRSHVHARSPRDRRPSSPCGRIVSHKTSPPSSRHRLSSPLPPPRKFSSSPVHRVSPPPLRRMRPPPPRRLTPPPSSHKPLPCCRLGPPPPSLPMMRIETCDVHHKLRGCAMEPSHHEIEIRFQQQKREHEKEHEQEREALRRVLQMEHACKEQELMRQMREMQEREDCGCDAFQRQQRELQDLQKSIS